jgi:fructokinase
MSILVTCMGESLIDFVPLNTAVSSVSHAEEGKGTPQETRNTDFRMYAGGSLFNVAIGLARLEQHTAFAGKIADDYFGHHLLHTLQAEGVDTRFVAVAKAQTTLAFVTMEAGEPAFTFYGEGTADTLLTVNDVPESLYSETNILHIGSISLLRGITPQTVLATVERLKGKALLSLDPNIRRDLVQDEAKYRALLQHLIALTDIFKLSYVDLAWLLPGMPMEEAIRQLCALGPALVMVTHGEKGVLARTDTSQTLSVPTFPVTVSDTVGAGDSFCAGTLGWLADHAITTREQVLAMSEPELQEMLRFASAVAALNCTRPGANPPRRTEVEQFLQTGL